MTRGRLRGLSTVLIVAGALLLVDAGLTLAWQEPVSALYAQLTQDRLESDLEELERAGATSVELRALAGLRTDTRRIAFLARSLKRRAKKGSAVGRIEIPRLDRKFVLVAGTDAGSLRKGPGIYPETPFPGAPGTVGIAGHRTTYLAPFRKISELKPGNVVVVVMPYGRFTYRVERRRIVDPGAIWVIRRVAYDRLVLTACHPLHSAAQRIVVFARLARVEPRGAALRSPAA
jgi:sortase A